MDRFGIVIERQRIIRHLQTILPDADVKKIERLI